MRFKLTMENTLLASPYEHKEKSGEVIQKIKVCYMGDHIDVAISPAFLRDVKLGVMGTALVEGEFEQSAGIWQAKDGRQGAFIDKPFKADKLIGFTPVGGQPVPVLSGSDKK